MKKLTVALLFGGVSSEHDVSCMSARTFADGLDAARYDVYKIGITKDGRWLYYPGPSEKMPEDQWLNCPGNVPCLISPDRSCHGMLLFEEGGVRTVRLDAAIPVLHGKNGEDGTIQGLFELAGIPYVGCGVLASAVCMDKDASHRLAAAAGVRSPQCEVLYRGASDEACLAVVEKCGGYPVFVKPARGGSSIGVSKAADEAAYREEGRSIYSQTLTKMGEVDEIVITGDGFFRIHLEKDPGANTELRCPAELSADVMARVREAGRTVYEALGCSGFARVDLFVTPEGEVVFNEVNSTPGMTYYSRFPQMMRVAGHELGEVLAELIDTEMEN